MKQPDQPDAMNGQRHMLVAGGSGVIGAAAVEHFAALPGWRVTSLSRRPALLPDGCPHASVSLDLRDRDACLDAVAAMPPVTHLIYAAYLPVSGLVSGWSARDAMETNARMFENILDPLAEAGHLRHVSLVQGTKAYGAHYHEVEVPSRESRPRDDHPNVYFLHEDHLLRRAREAGFAATMLRPQVVVGGAPRSAMNPAIAIGAYAALCRELGRPFAYPGADGAITELVDAALLARAMEWAANTGAAANEAFNITNGDVFVAAHAWPHIGDALGLATGGEPPASLAEFFAQEDVAAAWTRLVARHGLRVPSLPDLLGEAHHYVDILLSPRLAAKPLPILLSTIKVRQAGFGDCIDSIDAVLQWIARMADMKILPPIPTPAISAKGSAAPIPALQEAVS